MSAPKKTEAVLFREEKAPHAEGASGSGESHEAHSLYQHRRGKTSRLSTAERLARGAATLAATLEGVSPSGGNCLVATVVISGSGKGDRSG